MSYMYGTHYIGFSDLYDVIISVYKKVDGKNATRVTHHLDAANFY